MIDKAKAKSFSEGMKSASTGAKTTNLIVQWWNSKPQVEKPKPKAQNTLSLEKITYELPMTRD